MNETSISLYPESCFFKRIEYFWFLACRSVEIALAQQIWNIALLVLSEQEFGIC
jgi:hypothetical protein